MRILLAIARKSLIGLSLTAVLVLGVACHVAGQGSKQPKLPESEFHVRVELARGSSEGTLIIDCKIPISPKTGKPYHIYSTRTSDNFNPGRATTVTFEKGSPWKMLGKDFTADHKPHSTTEDGFGDKPDDVEHFENKVTWKRKILLKAGVAPETATLAGIVKYQMCDERNCRPLKHSFKAQVTIME